MTARFRFARLSLNSLAACALFALICSPASAQSPAIMFPPPAVTQSVTQSVTPSVTPSAAQSATPSTTQAPQAVPSASSSPGSAAPSGSAPAQGRTATPQAASPAAQPAATPKPAQASAPSAAGAALPGAAPSPLAAAGSTPSLEGAAAASQGLLPRGFRSVELGMTRDEAIAALKADPVFGFRGPADVSLLASPNESLIEVEGPDFIKRAFFQFHEGRLWVIIVQLNPGKVDHYSVFTSLRDKYGEPLALDPKECRWESDALRLSLERPLSLRYLDLKVFAAIRGASAAAASREELERLGFLADL